MAIKEAYKSRLGARGGMPETIQEGRGVEEAKAGGSATVQRAGN